MKYDHKKIEKKWQESWEKNRTFEVVEDSDKKKYYCLDMFPYPSGDGLHVGHPEGYTATDIFSRYLRMHGYNVMHPMGWDAFGLPAENFAIKKGIHPATTTKKNIDHFRKQIKSLGFSYDWSREVNTASQEYYKWTQWLFLELHKHGLAYKRRAPVNWCTSCQTVLANEQVQDGTCERCKSVVVQKELEQWFFKVTQYAEELLGDLDSLDWPEPIKSAQRNSIGKSEGAEIEFKIKNQEVKIKVFTTRPDTLFGATYLVMAPEHPLIMSNEFRIENQAEVDAYIAQTKKKTELERLHLEKEKTGVECKGGKAINPATGKEIPIWIADYCVVSYGTGAIMAVPAHDERDFAFAKKFGLPITMVVCPHYPAPTCPVLDEAYTGQGHLVESGQFNGMKSNEAKQAITDFVGGIMKVNYKIRDWLISRQRYWGAPIPIIYCEACGEVPVPEIDLPVTLPTDVDFRPTGESPLVRSASFHNVKCPNCGKNARRESDTMDTFVCSSWYFLRYASANSSDVPFEKEKIDYWLPVDMYVGGAEHAVLHLLYARFITKALRDMGYLNFSEPFSRLRNQGLILGEDGEKMSKSRGNVINPDEIIELYGADTIRLYEMFMGPFEDAKPWNAKSIIGIRRFLEKVWRVYASQEHGEESEKSDPLEKVIHKTIKKVTQDIVTFKFNTAISALMICANALTDTKALGKEIPVSFLEKFILLLSPFAPHMAEELWQNLGKTDTLAFHQWPTYDEALLEEETYRLIIQVNGKVRDSIEITKKTSDIELKKISFEREIIKKWTEGKTISKTVIIPNRLINIVVE